MASISDRVGDVGAYLREQRENARLSVRQLASLTGVSNPYLSQVERGLRRPSAEVLQQLAKGLRISAEALYVRAGILEDGPRGTVEFAVESDEGLTSRQKKVLLELCAHFRSENARAEEDATARAAAAAAEADAPAAGAGDVTDDPAIPDDVAAPDDVATATPVTTSAPDARGTEKELS